MEVDILTMQNNTLTNVANVALGKVTFDMSEEARDKDLDQGRVMWNKVAGRLQTLHGRFSMTQTSG